MKKKYFMISDIHGFYSETIDSLQKSGYDETNPSHLLVVLGDIFDRGEDAVATYEWLKKLTEEGKAVVLYGNHHKMLIDYLEGTVISPFNWANNGLNTTLDDFTHRTDSFQSWCLIDKNCEPNCNAFAEWIEIARKEINNEYPELLPWLKSLPRYFETKKYIATHGAIDVYAEDWKYPHCFRGKLLDWDALDFDDGTFFGKSIQNTDKVVVIGHFGTMALRKKYDIEEQNDDILIRDDGKVIAIDATTVLSHKVNVFIVEDEELEGELK